MAPPHPTPADIGKEPLSVQWAGHATVVVRFGDYVIVTDPVLTRRVAHLLRRHPAPPITRSDLVIVSHLHADHLHRRSLRTLRPDDGYVVPRGAERSMPVADDSVRGVRSGDHIDGFGPGLTIDVVHAAHDPRRGPHTRATAEPVGYVIRDGQRSVYFAGDTDLFDDMASIGPVDIALLPIAGWGPTTPPGHLDPERAAEAARRIGARSVIPIHWGTYAPLWSSSRARWFRSPLTRFRTAMEAVGLGDRIHPLAVGETWTTASGPPSHGTDAASRTRLTRSGPE